MNPGTQGEAADILYVEDNPFDVALTLRTLRKCNVGDRVVVLGDGTEAIDYIFGTGPFANRGPGQLPRLVLLDLKLPKLNGIQVLQWLRADKRTHSLPVVVLTSSQDDRDVVESYKLGVLGYIVKPLDTESFIKILQDLELRKRQTA